ncbi:cytidylate kinase [Bacteroidota bacterium]|nr:cytidylate kinase [Bacteroidota bacterium]
MNRKIIVAIDGHASCGKSTLARQLANKLGYIYVDSGAMYRAVTLYFIENGIDYRNKGQMISALKNINISFQYNEKTEMPETLLNGNVVEKKIRSMKISEAVSPVSSIKEVREFLVAQQQAMGNRKGLTMDGRDIGTVVFPDAELKIFLTSNEKIRAERRFIELHKKGIDATLEEVVHNLESRDYEDSHRITSPLYKAGDAIELDNTNLSEEQQLEFALNLVNEKISELHKAQFEKAELNKTDFN